MNALRGTYDYVFTSGGIGPTHDDITADAISKAFGVPCEHDAEAMKLMADMYERRDMPFTEARQRMARMPVGATHIANPVSTAPGFTIGNVHVMAGVPQVFQAMLDNVIPTLRTGTPMLSTAVACPFGEGDIGTPLGAIQKAHPETSIGSYPAISGRVFDGDRCAGAHRGGDAGCCRRSKTDDRDHPQGKGRGKPFGRGLGRNFVMRRKPPHDGNVHS